eukprot:SAG25_NODE_1994_length_2049_cov_1.851206_2_plen_163_part_00
MCPGPATAAGDALLMTPGVTMPWRQGFSRRCVRSRSDVAPSSSSCSPTACIGGRCLRDNAVARRFTGRRCRRSGLAPPRAVAVTAAAAAAAAAPTVQRGIAHHLRAAVAEAGGERLAVRRLRERAVPVRMMLPRLGLGLGLGLGHWVVALRRESDSRLLALG